MAAGDLNNIKLGPCKVTFNAIDLGFTKGGVEVEITTTKKKVTVDQFGETDVNEYITGRQISVKVPLAETDLATLASVLPGATLVTDATTSSKKKITVPSGTGLSLRGLANILRLHPYALADSDKSQDLTIPLAAPSGDISFAFRANEERVYAIEFTGYADATTGLLYTIGDPSATAA